MSETTVVIDGREFWDDFRTIKHRASKLRKASMKIQPFQGLVRFLYPAKLYATMYVRRWNRRIQHQIDRTPLYLWAAALLTLAYAGQVAATSVRGWEAAIPRIRSASLFLSSERFHMMLRKHSVTTMYAVGALLAVGTLPKILMVVWSL